MAKEKKGNMPKIDYVRMNIEVPKSFYKKIKLKALHEERSVKRVVVQALEEYLDK